MSQPPSPGKHRRPIHNHGSPEDPRKERYYLRR